MGKKMLIAQGGGPTPVINASLAGVILEAKRHGVQAIAGIGGIEGVIQERFYDLSALSEIDILRLKNTPSSGIGSGRYKVKEEDYPRIRDVLDKHRIDYFFYNGGNDSMDTCNKVSQIAGETRVIGVAKTIDNDLALTDHCPGFGSAARYAAVTVKELGLDVRALPIHAVIIEIMGRNAGWLAASTALARDEYLSAPHLIYLPERPFIEEKFYDDVNAAQQKYGTGIVIAVSEGLTGENGKTVADSGMVDGFGHTIPGGVAQTLSTMLLQKGIKSRSEKPGLVGRVSGFLVSETDREEAFETGKRSFMAAWEGVTGFMVGFTRLSADPYKIKYELFPLSEVANEEKLIPDSMIMPDGNDVNNEFVAYAKPLIGGMVPKYFTIPYAKEFL